MVNLEYINLSGISIGLYRNGPVGVSVSGGADSAILLYVLMANLTQPIHIYNMWTSKRKNIFGESVDSVIETCSQLTGNKNFIVHKKQVEPDESIEFYFKILTEALDKKEIDIVYLGVTNFPPEEVYLKFNSQQPDWHNEFRSDKVEHPVFGLNILVDQADDFGETCPITTDGRAVDSIGLDSRAYVPLYNHNKKDIAKLYKDLNLEKTLLLKTRSCENDENPNGHCGSCWWCHERIWAFGSLGE